MGWCGGTVVFDAAVKAILSPVADKKQAIKSLIKTLEDSGWDCQCESDYFNDPLVKECFVELGSADWYED